MHCKSNKNITKNKRKLLVDWWNKWRGKTITYPIRTSSVGIITNNKLTKPSPRMNSNIIYRHKYYDNIMKSDGQQMWEINPHPWSNDTNGEWTRPDASWTSRWADHQPTFDHTMSDFTTSHPQEVNKVFVKINVPECVYILITLLDLIAHVNHVPLKHVWCIAVMIVPR